MTFSTFCNNIDCSFEVVLFIYCRNYKTFSDISAGHRNIKDKHNKGSTDTKSDSLRTKLHNTVVGRVMLSHDASLRKSEAARSRVAFSTSIN